MHQPLAGTVMSPSASAESRAAFVLQRLDDRAVAENFEMIDRNDRTQARVKMQRLRPGATADFAARLLALDLETEQRAVGGERAAGLERLVQLRGRCRRRDVHEHAVHANGAAQRCVIGHRVGARARGDAEAKIEQPVPDVGRGLVIGKADDLVIVDAAMGDVGG